MTRERALWTFLAAVAAWAGWSLRGAPPPQIREVVRVEERWRTRTEERRVEGPVRVVVRTRRSPAAPGCPPVLERERVEDRGPVLQELRTQADSVSQARAERAETPATPPRWAASAGVGLDQQLRLGAGVRVAGPIWIDVAAVPARRDLSASVRVEW